MIKAEKKYVVAYTHAQARHFAQSMNWKRDEWGFVSHPAILKGLHGIVLYDVRAPRYKPTQPEAAKYADIREMITEGVESTRIAKLNVVNLP